MRRHPRSEHGTRIAGLIAAGLLLLAATPCRALAGEEIADAQAPAVASKKTLIIPCAVIEDFRGEIQILDPSRTQLGEADRKSPIACDGWVSTGSGWAEIRHRSGFMIHVGSNTFLKFVKNDPSIPDAEFGAEQLVLYKGQVYAQAGGGSGELRIVTANGRARVSRGKILLVFNKSEEETQLISLENEAHLENRFEPEHVVTVHPGEGSSLNFRLLRVVPSMPVAVSAAALRPKFNDLNLDQDTRKIATREILKRQGRKFAATLYEDSDDDHPGRKIASVKPKLDASRYLRHQVSTEDSVLHAHWVKKMVGGEKIGERILYPDKYYGRTQRV
ncbi:MAG: hypothetical protein ACXVBC_13100, partial [Bdellovibrionota bacterium]